MRLRHPGFADLSLDGSAPRNDVEDMTQMDARKTVALVAHDQKKPEMVAWARRQHGLLSQCDLFGTGTTGSLVAKEADLNVTCLKSGPLGGDQQLGAMISEGKLDVLIFFSDPLAAMPHDVDVKALLRISTLYQTVMACNAATADFVLASPLFTQAYTRPATGL